jgi:hypothetical protein
MGDSAFANIICCLVNTSNDGITANPEASPIFILLYQQQLSGSEETLSPQPLDVRQNAI